MNWLETGNLESNFKSGFLFNKVLSLSLSLSLSPLFLKERKEKKKKEMRLNLKKAVVWLSSDVVV